MEPNAATVRLDGLDGDLSKVRRRPLLSGFARLPSPSPSSPQLFLCLKSEAESGFSQVQKSSLRGINMPPEAELDRFVV